MVTTTVVSASAPSNVSSASTPPIGVSSNASQEGQAQILTCLQPDFSVYGWYYNDRSRGPYSCYAEQGKKWAMHKAYRSGGTEGVHWKYTDKSGDGGCIVNWIYYAEDGRTVLAKVRGTSTYEGDTRRWCALPVYRSGGVEGKQWGYCDC